MQDHPAPLICHLTDDRYTGRDPEPVVRAIMRMRNMDQLVRAGISVRTLVNLDEQVLADLLERVDAGADAEALRRFAEGRAVA